MISDRVGRPLERLTAPASGLSAKFDDLDTLDLDMPSAAESGISLDSDVLPASAQDLILPEDAVSLSDKPVTAKPPSDGGGSVLELGEDDDVLGLGSSGVDSDVTRSVSDSGISLVDPSDSGLSLERNDLQLAGSKLESLDLGGDDLISLDDQDLSEAPTQLKADDDFLLTPAEEATTEESSGSQVIALDSELDFDESSATMVGGGPGVTALEEEEEEPSIERHVVGRPGARSAGQPAADDARWPPQPTMAAMTAGSDMNFAWWNILLLMIAAALPDSVRQHALRPDAQHVELERCLSRQQLADGYDFELVRESKPQAAVACVPTQWRQDCTDLIGTMDRAGRLLWLGPSWAGDSKGVESCGVDTSLSPKLRSGRTAASPLSPCAHRTVRKRPAVAMGHGGRHAGVCWPAARRRIRSFLAGKLGCHSPQPL